jgi:hypothetical protein
VTDSPSAALRMAPAASKSTSSGRNYVQDQDPVTEPDSPVEPEPGAPTPRAHESSLPTVVGRVTGAAVSKFVRGAIARGRDSTVLIILVSIFGASTLSTFGEVFLGLQPSVEELAAMKADAIEFRRRLDDVEADAMAIDARTHEAEYRQVVLDRMILDRLDRIDEKLLIPKGEDLPVEIEEQFTAIEDEHRQRAEDEREAEAIARAKAAAARRGKTRGP